MPQRIVFPEQGRVELQGFELPPLDEGCLRLRTHYSLMSIGTETTILHARYDAGTHFDRMFSFPQLQTGVQAVACVEAVGPQVSGFAEGDFIFMRMAHGSHQVLAAQECSLIPKELDLKKICWAGLAKTAFRAAHVGQFAHRDSVLIVGAGPVGQMLVRWAHAAKLARIVVVDSAEARLKHADGGGAHTMLHGDLASQSDAVRQLWNGAGPELIVDTTGNPAVFASALSIAGQFATVILLGDTGYPEQQRLTSDVMTKGLSIIATHESHDRDGWTQARVDAHFFEAVAAGRFPLDGLITHTFEPHDCVAAYDLATHRREQAMGILFDWTSSEYS